jgi:uncharacterized protein (TIGR00369 family)
MARRSRPPAADRDFDQRVAAARRFNRFYTRKIGLLDEGFLGSSFSLTQVRVLYELAHRDRSTATELNKALGLDAGYLSRVLRGFAQDGLIARTPSKTDGRQSHLALTQKGQEAFAPLNARSRREIAAMLRGLPPAEQDRALDAMHTIEALLGGELEPPVPRPTSANSHAERRVRESFARQGLMKAIGATLSRVAAGEVEIEVPFRSTHTQQHGYVHAGIITTAMDTACGYAAMSLTQPGTEVLTAEYKANFLAPARGERFMARGRVARRGRTLIVCTGEAFAIQEEGAGQVALMVATIVPVAA